MQREAYPPKQEEAPPDYPDPYGPDKRKREGFYDRDREAFRGEPPDEYGRFDRRDTYGGPPDPYYDRRDPYYDRYDPYYRRYDPYGRAPPPPEPYERSERRPYYDPYSRPEYGRDYYDAYRPPPPTEERPYQKPEVIDHAHKSSADFLSREPETPYVAPQTVIDYGHGRTVEEKERPSAVDRDRDRFRDYGSYGSPSRDRSVHEPRIEVVKVEDLLAQPGRKTRPPQIVVILRGLPGSGKTYVGKLIKDKEVQHGGGAPRMLCLDDYFMTEVEKTEKDPETGKKVKKKVLEYEYEPELEDTYRQNMFKSFKKTIDDGFFPFIIVDSVNQRVKHFEEFWSYAKSKGFQVYIAEIEADLTACSKRNTHNRSLKEVEKIQKQWEETPRHYLRLDVRTVLQEDSITEVEMEDEDDNAKPSEKRRKTDSDDEEEIKIGGVHIKKSKWEVGTEEELDKLDGIVQKKKRRPPSPVSIDEFLGEYYSKPLAPGQKRVRWADVEERKEQLRRREIGFVVGQTQRDWERITDDTFADRQLNRTKYI